MFVVRAAVLLALAGNFLNAQPKVTLVPLDTGTGILTFAPPDPAFQTAAESLIPASDLAAFQPMLPYSIVLRNNNRQAVIAISLYFEVTGADGRIRKLGQRSGDIPAGPRPLMEPSEKILAPMEGPCVSSETRFQSRPWRNIDYYASAKAITIMVDSVLFADGTFAGPDRQNSFAYYTDLLAADKALSQAILAYKGKSLADLQQYLATTAELDRAPEAAGKDPGTYTHRLSTISRAYQKELARHGADAVFESVALSSAAPGFAIHH